MPQRLTFRTRGPAGTSIRGFTSTVIEWRGQELARGTTALMRHRLTMAGQFLRDKTRDNISVPVVRRKSSRTGNLVVVERSKPGEFPRKDTGQLWRSIFFSVETPKISPQVIVGFPEDVDYGLTLEFNLDRSFLLRTFREEQATIIGIITAATSIDLTALNISPSRAAA